MIKQLLLLSTANALKLTLVMPAVLLFASLSAQENSTQQSQLEELGRLLFFDVNLSMDRTQSCATCHDLSRAFIDVRSNGVAGAASMGADAMSLGDRNAPSIAYAAMIPEFHVDTFGNFVGGLFWDGRAENLEKQAEAPALNVKEMGMPDAGFVVSRLRENAHYESSFKALFGDDIFADAQIAFAAKAQAIAAFERSKFLSPFDSKYDRYLQGQYNPSPPEALGMALFFSPHFTSCAQCHQLNALPSSLRETFSNYRYENIGLPINETLRSANGLGPQHTDHGLLGHPLVDDPLQDGRFKVPTLRNIAVTAPYMHNGIFQDLRTVVLFYNKYNTTGGTSQINPETGAHWGEPEVAENIAMHKLQDTLPLESRQIDALLAFLRMLTDQRYEHLLD